MMRMSRRIWRYSRVAQHICNATAKVGLLWHRWPEERKHLEIQKWSRTAIALFGFDVVIAGVPPATGAPAPMLVANHTSWLDIYAILSHTPAVFVAKRELRSWPIIGNLAERLGSIFLHRDRRASLVECLGEISHRLANGTPVGVFPEGTTTDGMEVRPFHASLFEAAARTGAPVQPVAIRYLRSDLTRATEANFTGDATLIESFRELADCRNCIVEITFLQPINSAGRTRQWLAAAAECAIRNHLLQPTNPTRLSDHAEEARLAA